MKNQIAKKQDEAVIAFYSMIGAVGVIAVSAFVEVMAWKGLIHYIKQKNIKSHNCLTI